MGLRRARSWRWILGLAALAAALVAGVGSAPPAAAISIGPGETLDIPFVIAGTPEVAGGVDVFTLSLGAGSGASGLDSLTVQLIDEGVVLGESTGGFQTLYGFTEPGSLWTLNAVPADLSTLADDGTDAGVVRLIPSFVPSAPTPSLDVELPLLMIGRGTQASGLLPASFGPVVIPEPGTAVLLGLGVLGLAARRRGAAPIG